MKLSKNIHCYFWRFISPAKRFMMRCVYTFWKTISLLECLLLFECMSPVSTILSWRYQKCPTYAFNYYIRMSLTWHSRRRKRTRNWNIFQTFVSEQIHSVCALWEKNKCIPFETQQHLWLWVDFDVVSTHCWTHQHHHKYNEHFIKSSLTY